MSVTNYVSVGKVKNIYMNVDLDDFVVFVGMNQGLNDKKYKELEKKSKTIYTVIGLVSRSLEYKSFLGYIIANNEGHITLVKEDKLIELLKKYPCMNYSLTANESGRIFLRKSPNVVIKEYVDEDLKEKFGYSFDDFQLNLDMNLDEIEFCMQNNGFKLGFKKDFPAEYFGNSVGGTQVIYYNKDGTQIILNYINSRKTAPLRYYHQSLMIMRDVDHKKYQDYLRNNPYNSCSSSPLVDPTSHDLDPNHTEILFTATNIGRFLNISESAKTYSKPVVPYSLGHNMYSIHSVFNVTPYQDKKIKEYMGEEKNWAISDFLRIYMGYLNMLNYSDGLKKYYSNFIVEMPKYFETYGKVHNLSDKQIQDMKKFVEKLS